VTASALAFNNRSVGTLLGLALAVLDLVVIAVVLQLIVLGLTGAVRRARQAPVAPEPADFGAGFGTPTGVSRVRRCENCRSRWVGFPGPDDSPFVLRLRRIARRRARRRGQPAPEWARRKGWNRCPSCFSTAVRDSRRQSSATR
jgi:hypothetical protein